MLGSASGVERREGVGCRNARRRTSEVSNSPTDSVDGKGRRVIFYLT
jgi:hypothetical protein